MNVKILIAAVAGLVGLAASADVLYWQVNNSTADANTKSPYSYAVLRASDNSAGSSAGTQYYVSENINAAGENIGAGISRTFFENSYAGGVMDAAKILTVAGNTAYGVSGDSLSPLYFFLELYDSSGNWVGETSPAQAYTSLVNNGTISGFDANFKGVNAALGSAVAGSYQIPEPTSGLLMLVGLGALALRRRKVA